MEKKSGFLTAVIVGVTLICLQLPVFSEPSEGDLAVSQNFGAWRFEGDQDLKNGMILQTGLMYHLSDREALELSIGLADTSKTVPPRDHEDGIVLRADIIRYFPLAGGEYAPYFACGAGTSTLGDREHDINPLFNYGGGVFYDMTDRVALRADLRHVYDLRRNSNNMVCALGVAVRLGKTKTGPVPEPEFDPFASIAPDAPSFGILAGEDGKFEHFDLTGDIDPMSPDLPVGVTPSIPGADAENDLEVNIAAPQAPGGVSVAQPSTEPEEIFGEFAIDPARPGTLIVLFDKDKAEIPVQYAEILEETAEYMENRPAARLSISGHTDNIGSESYNLKLSQKRAQSVAKYMTDRFGIPEERLIISWFGEKQPLANNDTEKNRKKNRRVEISFQYQTEE